MVLKILLILSISLASSSSHYDTNKKRVDKLLSKMWEDIPYQLNPIDYPSGYRGDLYQANNENGEPLAYVLFDEAPSKIDMFTYMIVFGTDAAIAQVYILLYKENYGGEIASKRFLKQYIGKGNGQSMEYMQDIDGISGATISVRSLNHAVKINSQELYTYLHSEL